MAALCAPRKLFVQIGKEDAVFDYRSAVPELERVKAYYQAFGHPDHYKYDIWEGGHRISDSDVGFDMLFSEL